MTRTDLRVLFEIPDYWTPEQALAVYELLDGLRERILSRYEGQNHRRRPRSMRTLRSAGAQRSLIG
jgi:hypothetical protein